MILIKNYVEYDENDRGVSVILGEIIVQYFNKKNDLDLIIRAHQVVDDGYEFFVKRQLIIIFSAPNYCGEFHNSIMYYNESINFLVDSLYFIVILKIIINLNYEKLRML